MTDNRYWIIQFQDGTFLRRNRTNPPTYFIREKDSKDATRFPIPKDAEVCCDKANIKETVTIIQLDETVVKCYAYPRTFRLAIVTKQGVVEFINVTGTKINNVEGLNYFVSTFADNSYELTLLDDIIMVLEIRDDKVIRQYVPGVNGNG